MAKLKYYSIKLILLTTLVFIFQLIFPSLTSIFILNSLAWHEPWRFVTSIFLHASLAHLIYNMIALFAFGLPLEGKIGSNHFLWFYLISGTLVNLFVVNFYNSSLGASGAIFAVIGFLAAISPFSLVIMPGFLPMPLILAAFFWALLSFFGLFIPSNVGHLAHLAGLFFGLFYGTTYKIFVKRKT